MEQKTFDGLLISEEIKQAIAEMGFTHTTDIQAQAIPVALEGHDVLGQAQTGTGKTAAFGIPLIEMIDTEAKYPQALVLCPTRELAVQVAEEIKKIARFKKGLHVAAVYGGDSMDRQLKELRRGVQVVIGTPGRVMDHLSRGTLKTDNIGMVVLDEADEMLNMGFLDDMKHILQHVPEERQTMLFSATMPPPILQLTHQFLDNPVHVEIARGTVTNNNIEQFLFSIRSHQKLALMNRLIEYHQIKLMLVFCNTRKQVDELVEQMLQRGMTAEGLHGDMKQAQRNAVMNRFRNNAATILVATDVAARGIDVNDVEAVFNFDLPLDPEYYVHRIGRTGRAGKKGLAFTFVTGREMGKLREIERYTKARLAKGHIPTNEEIAEARMKAFAHTVKKEAERGDITPYTDFVQRLVAEGMNLETIAGVLTRLHVGELAQQEEITQGEDEPRTRSSRMVRLFVNVGKQHRISKGDLLGAFTAKSGVRGKSIGTIEVYDKFSYVEVAEQDVKTVMRAMSRNTIKGSRVNLEIAN